MKRPDTGASYILRFFAYLSHVFCSLLPHSLLGRFFTSYSRTDRVFRRSAIGRGIRRAESGGGRARRSLRRNVALAMNKSLISNSAAVLWRVLCRCSLRTFGALFATMGAYTALMYWLFSAVWESNVVSTVNLFWGLGFALIGILLLFSDLSLGYALSKSFFFGKLIVSALGVSDGGIRTVERVGRAGYVVAIPLGMALGAIGALVSPLWLLAAFVVLLLVTMVLSIPESGVVVLIFAVPFVGFLPNNGFLLVSLTVLPFVAYFGKLLRGNRAFHLEVQDIPVLLMAFLFLLSGFSFAGQSVWRGALLAALLAASYFLFVNLIATPRWMSRCRMSLVLSAALSALVGIVQFLAEAVGSVNGFDLLTVGQTVTAGFSDRVSFSYFLLIAFPFAVMTFLSVGERYRLIIGLALTLIVAAAVMACVPSVLLAMAVMCIALFLLCRRNAVSVTLAGVGVGGFLAYLMPSRARDTVLGFLRADVAGLSPYASTLNGLAGRILFGGEGVFDSGSGLSVLLFGLGRGGLERICVFYTAAPAEAMVHAMGFWTYRLLEGGVIGVLLPAAFLLMLSQNCFSLMRRSADGGKNTFALTGIALIVGLLLNSLFHYTWYDPSAMLMFFAATGMIVAEARGEWQSRVDPVDEMTEPGQAAELEYYGAGH